MRAETENETMDEGFPPEAAPPGHVMPPRHEMCVPLSALAMPDEAEAMEPPAVGDAVQFNAEGKVSRIEGEDAYVRLTAVNGQQVPERAAAPEPTEADQLADLETEARNQPDRYA